MIEYRLSWDSPDSWACAVMEDVYGKDCWPRVNWDELPSWSRTDVIFTDGDRMDQYTTLKKWAESREQPIRNVLLEKREIVSPDHGWQPVSEPGVGLQKEKP